MKCRCGHPRQYHRRMSGHKYLPCQAVVLDPPTAACTAARAATSLWRVDHV